MATRTHPKEWLGDLDDPDGILLTTLAVLEKVNRG